MHGCQWQSDGTVGTCNVITRHRGRNKEWAMVQRIVVKAT